MTESQWVRMRWANAGGELEGAKVQAVSLRCRASDSDTSAEVGVVTLRPSFVE
jgi:hypothetical protein